MSLLIYKNFFSDSEEIKQKNHKATDSFMQRLLIALFFALSCHVLLISLPYSSKEIKPAVEGDNTIKINLTEAESIMPDDNHSNISQDIPQKKSSLKQQDTESIKLPVKSILQKQKVVEEAPVEQQSKINPSAVPAIEKKPAGEKQPLTETSPAKTHQAASPVQETVSKSATQSVVKAKPLYHRNPEPVYPRIARRRGQQGIVLLLVTVLENGLPGQVTLHKSSGHKLLDVSALKTVKRWHFLAGTINGQPVSMQVLVPVHFVIQ